MSQTNVQIVRLEKGKTKIEVLCKPGMITKYRDGKCGLNDAIIDDHFYSNSSKGEVASEADIAKFGATGHELLEMIVKTGKYSLTAQEKREMVEKRRLEVINYLHENFIDSASGKPHPVTRIEAALSEIKAQYDPDHDAEHIVRSLIPKLQPIIRLQESCIEGTVVLPNSKLGQCIGICYNLGTVVREEYGPQSAFVEMKVSPGKYDALIDQLSKMSNGEAQFKIKGAAATSEDPEEHENTKVRKKTSQGNRGKRGKK